MDFIVHNIRILLLIAIPVAILISVFLYSKEMESACKRNFISTNGRLFYMKCNICSSEWLGREKDRGVAVRKLRSTTYCPAGEHSAYPNLYSHIILKEVEG